MAMTTTPKSASTSDTPPAGQTEASKPVGDGGGTTSQSTPPSVSTASSSSDGSPLQEVFQSIPQHDEYTDYSCSTSVERLARDVETLLRQWHVDHGADRHASSRYAVQPAPKHLSHDTTTTTTTASTPVRSNKVPPQPSDSNDATFFTPAAAAAEPTTRTAAEDSPTTTTRLLRSASLTWVVSFFVGGDTKLSTTVELELCLWDGPLFQDHNDHDDDTASSASSLPLSLQQGPWTARHRTAPWQDFGALWGIGQHLTLTPQQNAADASAETEAETWQTSALWQDYLVPLVLQRHDERRTAPLTANFVWTAWLQTALQLAVVQADCQLPAIAWWGPKPEVVTAEDEEEDEEADAFGDLGVPSWLQHSLAVQPSLLPQRSQPKNQMLHQRWLAGARQRRQRRRSGGPGGPQQQAHLNLQHLAPLVAGTCHHHPMMRTTSLWVGCVRQHTASSSSRARLAAWGDLLLRYCPPSSQSPAASANAVYLWEARHVYHWVQPPARHKTKKRSDYEDDEEEEEEEDDEYPDTPPASPLDDSSSPQRRRRPNTTPLWRRRPKPPPKALAESSASSSASSFRLECLGRILDLVSTAAGASAEDPLWGPVGDPIGALWASVQWAAGPTEDALLQLPIKIRSSQALSEQDWLEAEDAMETSVLNPVRALRFDVQAQTDPAVVQTPLAAMQHCILAALIRTSTLPGETLLSHLTDAAVLEQWDTAAGNVIALNLGQRAQVGATTQSLCQAMDWDYAVEDMIEPWQALEIVRNVLDVVHVLPSPPEDDLAGLLQPDNHSNDNSAESSATASSAAAAAALSRPLCRAAPFGRLFSILCAYISRVRSPSSMVQVFGTFCQELRRRWDFRESLPNMNAIPGVDPPPPTSSTARSSSSSARSSSTTARKSHGHAKNQQQQQQQSYVNMETMVGLKKEAPPPLAAYSEQQQGHGGEPDEYHCLIGQKLQVFNLCLESVISQELRQVARLEKQQQQRRSSSTNHTRTTNLGDVEEDYMSVQQLPGAPPQPPPGVEEACSFLTVEDDDDDDDMATARSSVTFATAAQSSSRVSFSNTTTAPLPEETETDMTTALHSRPSAGSPQSQASQSTQYTDAKSVVSTHSTATAVDSSAFFTAPQDDDDDDDTQSTTTRFTDARSQSTRFTDARSQSTRFTDARSVASHSTFHSATGESSTRFTDARASSSSTMSRVTLQTDYEDARSVATKSTARSRYFDAGQTFATRSTLRSSSSQYFEADDGDSLYSTAVDSNNKWQHTRRGARCPVQGQTLQSNGHQVFAPYLQRPMPLTDDVVAQRRKLLDMSASDDADNAGRGGGATAPPTEQDWLDRLEVAHMMQRPKLSSDMSSFKAANPGCEFADFTSWYGEPMNPLAEQQQQHDDSLYGSSKKKSATKTSTTTTAEQERRDLHRATRSIRLLEKTRAFWSKTWTEAKAIPALEQEPLFSASDTVEIALDYLETLHPANLIASVMATNLSNAYFALVIAAQEQAATELPTVRASLTRLRRKIEIALHLLSTDTVAHATLTGHEGSTAAAAEKEEDQHQHPKRRKRKKDKGFLSYVSLETIAACETACRVIGDNEILLSNALSLLAKFPQQAELVEQLLQSGSDPKKKKKKKDCLQVAVQSASQRLAALDSLVAMTAEPHPVLRDYLFRNAATSPHPCQLRVRCGNPQDGNDEGDKNKNKDKEAASSNSVFGGLLVALTRTARAPVHE